MSKSLGFTVTQFLIALTSISLFVILIVSTVDKHNYRNDIKTLRSNVKILQKSLDAYILHACHKRVFITPTIDELLDSGQIFNSGQILNPFNNTKLSFSIYWANPTTYSVTADMKSYDNARSLFEVSGSTRIHLNTLVWDKVFNSSDDDVNGNREFRSAFEGDCS